MVEIVNAMERKFNKDLIVKNNAMLNHRPEFFYEWDFEKNDELGLDIYKITYGSAIKVWWKCELGHSYKSTPNSRTNRNSKCAICSNRKVLVGFNDMWTMNPKQASLLADPEDGYKYTQCSDVKVDWKCKDCSKILKNKQIWVVYTNNGFRCPLCSDKSSFPEKFMYYLLKQLNVEFEWSIGFDWLKAKKYDFYIKKYNMIIEVHGGQHYEEQGFSSVGGRTLAEEIANDKLKKDAAINNNIDNYIVIDARNSNMNFVKSSILESDLVLFFDFENIDFNKIAMESEKSIKIKILNLFNDGIPLKEISELVGYKVDSIRQILISFQTLGWCEYKTEKRILIQSDLNGKPIREWNTTVEASKELNISSKRIGDCCREEIKMYKGYNWSYIKVPLDYIITYN